MNSTSSRRTWAAIAAAALAMGVGISILVAWPSEATACGGFFCNQQQPVNQADENIVFTKNEDGSVTAVIQIRYSGPSEEFAWMLPVFGKPDVEVGSSTVFRRLTRTTNPSYNRDVEVRGTCESRREFGPTADAVAGSGAADVGNESGDSVTVVDQGTVGPFNFTTISVAKRAEDPAKDALEWLQSNGYDLTDAGPDLVRGYLDQNMNLIAFKLQKNAQSGEIRPVQLTYDNPDPMIPLKLTAVAAQEDMGIRVWVSGPSRAVPTKFDDIRLNPAAINWFNWGSNYQNLVSRAADEVGGRGFVTEYAGSADVAEDRIFTENDEQQWQNFDDAEKWSGREGELLAATLQAYWPRFGNSQWDGMQRVIRRQVPLPEDLSIQEFNRQRFSAVSYDRTTEEIEGFDPASYLDALEEGVVGPVRTAENLVQSRSHLTRMFTTISAGEMTRDPVFDFREDLPDVDRTRTAEQTIFCGDREYTRLEAPWTMELPDGTEVRGQGRTWPFAVGEIDAVKEAKNFGDTDGEEPEVVEDNAESIAGTIERHNADAPRMPSGSGDEDGGTPIDGGGTGVSDGCSTAAGSPSVPVWAGGLFALAMIRVRRD